MCEIKTKIDVDSDEKVLDILAEQGRVNNDGTGIVSYNKGSFDIVRGVGLDSKIIESAVRGSSIFLSHQRIATSGGISEKNIHFWDKGRWLFSHNGTIRGLSGNKEIVDSLLFFKQLISDKALRNNGKINWDKVKKIDDDNNFWGRFVLVDKKKKRIYFYGDFQAYMISDSTIIITSTDMDFDDDFVYCGLRFEGLEKIEYPHTELEGINYYDIEKKNFCLIDKSTTYWKPKEKEKEFIYNDMYEEYRKEENRHNGIMTLPSDDNRVRCSGDLSQKELDEIGIVDRQTSLENRFRSKDFYKHLEDKNSPEFFDKQGNPRYYWETEDDCRIDLELLENEMIPADWVKFIYELRNN